MARTRNTPSSTAPQPTSAPDSAVQGEMPSRVSVRVMPPHTHRRRAGMGFGQQAQTLSVSAEVLDALVNDPLLIVEEA